MKNRFLKSFAVLFLALSLCLSMTGCSEQDYRKAINLYNEEQYDAAATLFSELDGYKNSGELQTLCRYWEAITLMEEGAYSTALPRFIKLGNYEDSAERATECKYQVAIAAFEAGDPANRRKPFSGAASVPTDTGISAPHHLAKAL